MATDDWSLSNSAKENALVILNATNSEYYLFDGVVKVTHTLTNSFSDSTDANYVNSAKNEQDKVTIDAVMSDVHEQYSSLTAYTPDTLSGSEWANAVGSIAKYGEQVMTRSARALEKLWSLKTNRTKLTVITNQCYYHNMAIAEINVVNDENHPYGWEGQIVLKRMVAKKGSSDTLSGGTTPTGNNDSMLYTIAGIVVEETKTTGSNRKKDKKTDISAIPGAAVTGAIASATKVFLNLFDGTATYV